MMRRAGILLHPSSLPHFGPCGDLGDCAIRFLDWLKLSSIGLWQTLPMHPVGGGFSPYSSPSAFAGATYLISLDRLVEQGLLTFSEIGERPSSVRMDEHHISDWKRPLIQKAAARYAHNAPDVIKSFAHAHHWASDWALFHALKQDLGVHGWQDFPKEIQDRTPKALDEARERLEGLINTELAAQCLFFEQWNNVRQEAAKRNIQIIGDMPIFIAQDGCDAWVNRELFRWDKHNQADPVSGAPPDAFSPMGQHWGNPLYNWEAHRQTGFKWWIDRLKGELALADFVRIDHFRGFCAAWEIPKSAAGDARQGEWKESPGRELFTAVKDALGDLPFLAEDLGVITPDVDELREDFDLMGMKVLQFAFGDYEDPYLPHNYHTPAWACYTGTHDNDTCIGWYHGSDEVTRHRYRIYSGRSGQEPNWDLIRMAWGSIAQWSITTMQDILNLGSEGRMNIPGQAGGHWAWRAHDLPVSAAHRLASLAEAYGRK